MIQYFNKSNLFKYTKFGNRAFDMINYSHDIYCHIHLQDTRSYVVQEIYRNEQSYVESLQTVVLKYLKVLKSPEHAGMIDTRTVDEIFFMVPDILEIHEKFLCELKQRLDDWDIQQRVGDAFMETVSTNRLYSSKKWSLFH